MKASIIGVIIIVVAGSGLGLGFNEVRSNGSIKLSRNYFEIYKPPSGSGADNTQQVSGEIENGAEPQVETVSQDNDSSSQKVTDTKPESKDDLPEPAKLNNPFIAVTLDEMIDMYQNPGYGTDIIFVDARNDLHYEEGHIPGSIQVDRYNSDKYYSQAEEYLKLADTIVIYCGGGDCEDSIFLATEFAQERQIPYESLRVYEGGMAEWLADELETASGRDQ